MASEKSRNKCLVPLLSNGTIFGIIFTHIGGLRLLLMSAASLASENYETLKYKAVCGCSILGAHLVVYFVQAFVSLQKVHGWCVPLERDTSSLYRKEK